MTKYLSQVEEDPEKFLKNANNYFKESIEISQDLPVTNLTRLSSLNAYSKFLINFKKEKSEANFLLGNLIKSNDIQSFLTNEKSYDPEVNHVINDLVAIYNTSSD